MAMPAWLSKILGDGVGNLIASVGDTAKKFITTEKDRQEFEMALQQIAMEGRKLTMEAEEQFFKDRQSAREMYKTDSWLQKVFAITFLVGYLALTITMIYIVVGWIGAREISIPEWAVALISTIYGGMSAKVNTITDFLFGSSQGSREKDELQRLVTTRKGEKDVE